MKKLFDLTEKLNEASEAYYNGKEIMSNKEFDDLQEELKELEDESGVVLPNSPNLRVGADPVDSLPKFAHPYPAKSLDKTKDIDEFVSKFRKGIAESGSSNKNVVLMWKEDGSTVQAYYKKGKLDKLVTRGNGEVGSDITHNAKSISGIPLTIAEKGDVVVRGEALISYEDFEKINASLPTDEQFKNPRNLASASIQMLDSSEVAKRHVVVKAFNLVQYVRVNYADPLSGYGLGTTGDSWLDMEADARKFSDRLKILSHLGFNVVEHEVTDVDNLAEVMEQMSATVANYAYPVDGLVAAMDNYRYSIGLEGTEHHPNIMQGYAFKWADESKETVLREIEWSPSRTGLLNPVAVFDPIELEGTIVKRASVHNLSVIRKLNLKPGDRIKVYKANRIIPQISENMDKDTNPNILDNPTCLINCIGSCPTCGTPAKINVSADGIETVYCPNEECPEKMIGKFAHFCSRDCMDIQGMSEETIKKLVDAGFIGEYEDFFTLDTKPGIANLPGLGEQSWKKMCDAAATARSTTFVKFITALSIPNIGKGQAKLLYKYISTNYDTLCDQYTPGNQDYEPVQIFRWMALKDFDFTQIDGFGEVLSTGISEWAKTHWGFNTPETHVTIMVDFTDSRPLGASSSNSAISGKSFCITGKLVSYPNRQALVDVIEQNGGKWVDSVSSKTDYLINNDVTSTSGKNKKAKDFNIPIISEEDFQKML